MLQEGQKFGDKDRYELVRLLGRGGFSEVWLANDDWTHIQVAIKVYAPGTGLDEAGIALFTQEFSMVFDMNHTNLLKPTYFDSWERQPYLIMPLCQNGSAFKYVAGKERITEEQCWNMLHDVAAGLAYLHGKNPPLIHQDIKPDNILISDEGLYMITDFGISARVRSTIRNGMQAEEQSGGTLAYMGPERFSSRPRPIMASDIWSLGAMMYEIICGNPPFGNNGGLMQKKGAEIPVIEEEGFSQELKDIIYSCLNAEPANRPWASTIEEMTYKHIHGIDTPAPQTVQPVPEQPVVQDQPLQQPQMQQTAQPFQQTAQPYQPNMQSSAQPFQQSNGQPVPAKKAPNKKMIGIIAGVAAVVLIGLIIILSGGSDKEEAEAVAPVAEVIVPEVNLDSIAQVRIMNAQELALKAEEFQNNYSEELLDSAHGLAEKFYLDILNECKMYENEVDLAHNLQSDAALKDSTLLAKLDELKKTAEQQLLGIYKRLEGDSKDFASVGSNEMAGYYMSRASTIKPYIEHLLTEKTIQTTE